MMPIFIQLNDKLFVALHHIVWVQYDNDRALVKHIDSVYSTDVLEPYLTPLRQFVQDNLFKKVE